LTGEDLTGIVEISVVFSQKGRLEHPERAMLVEFSVENFKSFRDLQIGKGQ